ncbi:MAG: ABC transporter permease [Candidatus Omnitrophota bacterium]
MTLRDKLVKISAQKNVIKSLVQRNLSDKYIGSTIGIFWAVLNPLLIMCAINFVFTQIMPTRISNFPLFILSALLAWSFFANSLSEAAVSIKNNSAVLNQFVIMNEAIPLSVVLANFVNFLVGFIGLLPVFILCNTRIINSLALLPLVLLLHFVFTLGISLMVSIGNLYYKDLAQLLNIGLMFLFWLTPIFYPLESISKGHQVIMIANPATCYTLLYRAILYNGSKGDSVMWLFAFGFSLASIWLGHYIFTKKEKDALKQI